MSKIKNGGLDQYGKMYSLNGIGGERVNFAEEYWWTCLVVALHEKLGMRIVDYR